MIMFVCFYMDIFEQMIKGTSLSIDIDISLSFTKQILMVSSRKFNIDLSSNFIPHKNKI